MLNKMSSFESSITPAAAAKALPIMYNRRNALFEKLSKRPSDRNLLNQFAKNQKMIDDYQKIIELAN